MSHPAGRKRPASLRLESLETRRLLAAFGTPWPDARSLSVSFAADGTELAEHHSVLETTLDQIAERSQWQESALRALQTWAYHADINIGLRADHGADFGAPGLTTGDPRFGEFRFGAVPQTGVLANSLPFQIAAGTFSGDIFLNSEMPFSYHDWASGPPPVSDPAAPPEYDLFSVLLHEAGNALGLDDNLDSDSVMFAQYTAPKGILTAEDIAEIQSLYGQRTDPYEPVANDGVFSASLVPTPVGFDPAHETIDLRGSIRGSDDVDWYRFEPASGQSHVRVELNASGISLLRPRVSVFDVYGRQLATAEAASVFENDVVLDLPGLQNHALLFIRVAPADGSVYSVGDYQLRFDYRSDEVRASDPVAGSHDGGVESLWTHFSLADFEVGVNDDLLDAEAMPLAAGETASRRFEVLSALGAAADVDFWKLTAPDQVDGPLTVHLAPIGADAAALRVRIVDASGQPVGAAGWLREDGTWSLQVAQPDAQAEYFVRVSVDPGSAVQVGNYVASAEFAGGEADQMNQMAARTISSAVDDFIRWRAVRSKLYRFDLTTAAADADHAVQLTIYDAHTQEVRLVLVAPAGTRRTAFAMLSEGDYIFRFTALSRSGQAVPGIDFQLECDGLSDDQDPDDPTGDPDYNPDYDPYYYYYYEDDGSGAYDDPPPDPNYTYDYSYYGSP